jgi:streptogramin lyase
VDVWVDTRRDVWVTDSGMGAVLRFAPNGTQTASFPVLGATDVVVDA